MFFLSIMVIISTLFSPVPKLYDDYQHDVDSTYVSGEVHQTKEGQIVQVNSKQSKLMASDAISIVYYKAYKWHVALPLEKRIKHFQAGIIELKWHGVVYCIEPHRVVAEGVGFEATRSEDYFKDLALKEDLQWIATVGTSLFRETQDDLYYFATQKIIWERLGYHDVTLAKFSRPVEETGEVIALTHHIETIQQQIKVSQTLPSLPSVVTLETGTDKQLVDSNKRLSAFTLTNQVDGVQTTMEDNRITLLASKGANGTLHFELKEAYLEESFILSYPESQTLLSAGLPKQPQLELKVEAIEYGDLVIEKKSDVGASVVGTVFGLYAHDQLIEKQTVDENGFAYFKHLRVGEYVVKEEVAPLYHARHTDVFVQIKPQEELHITVVNQHELGSLMIKKRNEEGKPLVGATFGLFEQGKLIKQGVSNEDGIVLFEALLVGQVYQWQELVAPEHYQLDQSIHDVTVLQNKQIIEVVAINNHETEDVPIKKIDAITKKPMSDIGFRLYQGDQLVTTFKTNGEGEFVLKQLKKGQVYRLEEDVVNGYELMAPITFRVGDVEWKEIVIENNPKPFNLIIKKYDQQTKEPLVATFMLTDETLQTKHMIETDQQGEGVALKVLYPNHIYHITEVVAPSGYMGDYDEQFVMTEFEDKELTVFNQKEIHLPETGTYSINWLYGIGVAFLGMICLLDKKRIRG